MLKRNNNSALINSILILHGIVIVLLFAYLGKLLFIPLFFSFLIAVFLYPLSGRFERRGLNRLASSILCILILLLCCGIMTFFVGSQFQRFLKDIPLFKDKLDALISNSELWLKQHFNLDDDSQSNYIDRAINSIVNAVGFTVSSFLYLIVFLTLSLFFIFYMLFYRGLLNNFVLSFFNRANKTKVAEISYAIHETLVNYVKGLLAEILILMVLSSLTLLILGVKYAILMAFFAGLFNVIPYIGIYTAALLNMLITEVDGSGRQSIEVLLVFVAIHILDANLITPFIVGRRIKINPLVTLIAVISGEIIWGIPGMFLFIPLAAIINIILEKTAILHSNEIAASK
ncbi:MAG TPA: AI-2E family transporter [Parafilimonas sp.]